MKYQVQENCLTIFLPGEIDHHNSEELRKESDHLIERNHIRYVIFDFKETDFMDSSGIGIILGRYNQLKSVNGTVMVIGMKPLVSKVFELSGLSKIIKVIEDDSQLESAIRGIA